MNWKHEKVREFLNWNWGPCRKRGAASDLPSLSKLGKNVYKIIALT